MKIIFLIVISLCILACSNRAIYDNIQANNLRDCQALSGTQYKECTERNKKTYDQYKKDRQEVLEGKGSDY